MEETNDIESKLVDKEAKKTINSSAVFGVATLLLLIIVVGVYFWSTNKIGVLEDEISSLKEERSSLKVEMMADFKAVEESGNNEVVEESKLIKEKSFPLTSREYAVMGKQLWSAFECAAYSSASDDTEEHARLFEYGYEKGKIFIEAGLAEKIDSDDWSSNVPVIVSLNLGGPSVDFKLGNVWASALEYSLEDIYETDGEYNTEEMQELLAGIKYRDGNCSLIGR